MATLLIGKEILVDSQTKSPGPRAAKLLDRVAAKMRMLHYAKRTEGACVYNAMLRSEIHRNPLPGLFWSPEWGGEL